jgi:ankyrin repeat protein
VDEIRILVEGGAEVNVKGDMGSTPLHDAAQAGQLEAVKVLLQYGAKPDTVDEFGKTPCDWADLNGHSEIAKVLESHEKSL